MQTLEAMQTIVLEDRLQPDLRTFVLREIVRGVRGHDSLGEIDSIFRFARDRIIYRQDPVDCERVADIWSTLYGLHEGQIEPEGDCGIKSTFIASCCAMLGHKPFFVVIKQTANSRAFNHVYTAVVYGDRLLYLDATPEDSIPGWETKGYEKKLFPIF